MGRVIKTFVIFGLNEAKPLKNEAGFSFEGKRNLSYYQE